MDISTSVVVNTIEQLNKLAHMLKNQRVVFIVMMVSTIISVLDFVPLTIVDGLRLWTVVSHAGFGWVHGITLMLWTGFVADIAYDCIVDRIIRNRGMWVLKTLSVHERNMLDAMVKNKYVPMQINIPGPFARLYEESNLIEPTGSHRFQDPNGLQQCDMRLSKWAHKYLHKHPDVLKE